MILAIVGQKEQIKEIDMKEKEIHNKAIRLVEGGIVDIDGLCVAMRHERYIFDPCFVCELDCICHKGNNFCNVCEECDAITREDCFLVLIDPG